MSNVREATVGSVRGYTQASAVVVGSGVLGAAEHEVEQAVAVEIAGGGRVAGLAECGGGGVPAVLDHVEIGVVVSAG